MFTPIIVLLVFPVSVIHCCDIYDIIIGPQDPNLLGAYFFYLNISELGAAALHNNYSEIPDLLTICDVNSRAVFINTDMNWWFTDVPLLTFAMFGDALDIINEFLKVPDIDVNAYDSYGLTPLFWTVIVHGWGYGNNTMDITESLLKSGADPNIPAAGIGNITAVDYAATDEMYELLLEYGGYKAECEAAASPSCITVGGEMVGAKCVFPFVYDGTTYCGCADEGGQKWCSTRTDDRDRHTQGYWGICSDKCPIA